MANQIASFNMPTQYDLERSKIDRAQRMAEMLMQQSQAPAEQFSYGGYTAPTSPITGVSKVIQGLMSQYQMGQADDKLEKLTDKYRGEERADREALIRAIEPVPGAPGQPAYTPTGVDFVDNPNLQVASSGDVPAIAPTAAKPFGNIDSALMAQMKTPGGQQMVMSQIMAQRQAAIEASRKAQDPFTLNEGDIRYGIRPDGSYGELARAGSKPQSGDLGVYAEYARQMREAGQVPKTIEQFMTDQRIAARPLPAETFGSPVAAVDENGNPVFLQPGRSGGPPSVIQGYTPQAERLKQIPVSVTTAILDNEKSLSQIDRALALTSGAGTAGSKADPSATGIKGYLPDVILNRADPSGVEARAEIGDIGSLIIHDRSGAAVTAAESPRLKPFIPLISDDAETLKKKLNRLKAEVTAMHRGILEFYSEDQGYKPLPVRGNNANVPRKGTDGPQPSVTEGSTATNPQSGEEIIFKGGKWQPK